MIGPDIEGDDEWCVYRCTEDGLEALLQLRLIKYANPDHYREFFDDLLQRSTHKKIRCTISITANGGEV